MKKLIFINKRFNKKDNIKIDCTHFAKKKKKFLTRIFASL